MAVARIEVEKEPRCGMQGVRCIYYVSAICR